jgi:type 1 glutamine amidotransferase
MQANVDSTFSLNLAPTWKNTDEWYVFFSQPEAKILYAIDGEKILPSGNMLWMTDKNFGMGKSHPVAWYKAVGNGKTFYTSMGHSKDVWGNPDYVKLIENAIIWATKR